MTKNAWLNNPQGPAYIVGVTNFRYRPEVPKLASRAAMYRCLLQHLRLLPDPMVWLFVAPAMRKFCASYKRHDGEGPRPEALMSSLGGPEATVEKYAEDAKRKKTLLQAKTLLNEVRAAVACHPHALSRLISQSYGLSGSKRREHITSILKTSPNSTEGRPYEKHLGPNRPPIPKPLKPLIRARRSNKGSESDFTGGPGVEEPKDITQRQARFQWLKEYETVDVPILFPKGTGVLTGDEKYNPVQTLLVFSKLDSQYNELFGTSGSTPTRASISQYGDQEGSVQSRSRPPHLNTEPLSEQLDAYTPENEMKTPQSHVKYPLPNGTQFKSFKCLPKPLQQIFPNKLKPTMREPPFPRPPKHETKQQPGIWKDPIRLTPRLLTRTYGKIWNDIKWTRPEGEDVNGRWVSCSYEDILLWEEKDWAELKSKEKNKRWDVSPYERSRLSVASSTERDWLRIKTQKLKIRGVVTNLLNRK